MILCVLLVLLGVEPAEKLHHVKRVYVDQLTGKSAAMQMRDLLIASLQSSKLFIVTEDEERADAYLRGAAEEDIYTELHQTDEAISGNVRTSRSRGATSSRNREADAAGIGISERESSRIQERKHDAMATVRLVSKSGDVLWSTTQESSGGKFRGATADVAAKVVKQLAIDLEKSRRALP
ncbi:hypothetical protein F183_A03300 [Bryobacterales bacterium F-183]|nr:hypothetical protein F183_A03300 [Bryobacterales bacterium F-183]